MGIGGWEIRAASRSAASQWTKFLAPQRHPTVFLPKNSMHVPTEYNFFPALERPVNTRAATVEQRHPGSGPLNSFISYPAAQQDWGTILMHKKALFPTTKLIYDHNYKIACTFLTNLAFPRASTSYQKINKQLKFKHWICILIIYWIIF